MKIQTITHTYKDYNEDICGKTEHCSWVIDGALSLSKAKYTDDVSDVVWMVKWWNRYLEEHLEDMEKDITKIMEEGIEELNKDFSRFIHPENLSKLQRASASIGIVRINDDRVECYVLGDTEVNLLYKNGDVDTFLDKKIDLLDGQVIDMIYNKKNRVITFNGYTDEEVQILRNNRMKMNSADGYYILEHEVEAARNAIYYECALETVCKILIMSDGYAAVYNKYDCLSLPQLFEACKADGLKKVLDIIRIEEDKELKEHKRLRQHDDATAVFITV